MESPLATASATPDVGDLLEEFFSKLFSFFTTIYTRFTRNLYASFAEVSLNRWSKVLCSVVFYIIIRPYLERFFHSIHERDLAKQREKEKEQKEGMKGKKAKISPNALRATGGGEKGKVLGEVDNTDDEVDSEGDDEDVDEVLKTSGVPEWGRHARKRQKKYLRNLEKGVQQKTEELSDQQILELLDWSEDEETPAN